MLTGYRLHESLQIYRQLRVLDLVLSIVRSVVIVPRTALRCMRQRAHWPWSANQKYLQTPLRQLRQEFGIRVAHSHRTK